MQVRERLERLTNGEVKKIVTAAVDAEKAKKSKTGVKLIEEYNKLYVEILKFKKVYDVKFAEVEKLVKSTVGKDIDDNIFDEAQQAIYELRRQWAPIVASFKKFEATEAAIKKEYGLK
jgi:hypothetical protein